MGADQLKMPMPHVFFVYPGNIDTPTGGYRYDRRVLQEWMKEGVPVTPIALSATFPYPNTEDIKAAEACFARLPDGASVLVDGLALGVLDTLAQREQQRLNMVALCHHPLALETGLTATQRARWQQSEQRALAATQAVVVTSSHTRHVLMTQFAVPSSRITVALPGTDGQPFAHCSGEPPCLLTLASLTPRKGHDVLLQALAQLTDLRWRARWVGSPNLDTVWASDLVDSVQRLGLSDRITFVGTVAATEEEFAQADLFVLPSRFEGYGMVFAEALAAGLPIIAARAGAVPDVVPPDAGMLVPPDDAPALAQALRTVLTQPERRFAMQMAAQQAAASLPTWVETARCVYAALANANA